jgi:hypothetical protein
MNQFNRNTYKRESLSQQFLHSCLGKLVIFAIVGLALVVAAVMTVPREEQMTEEMEDNIRECLQDNYLSPGDGIDAFVDNINNMFTKADTLRDDREIMEAYKKYNELRIYRHLLFSTARIHNNMTPEGVRVGIGLFGVVIPTVAYTDLLLNVGTTRGDYNERLINDAIPDWDPGENPNVKPYHYMGNPDD